MQQDQANHAEFSENSQDVSALQAEILQLKDRIVALENHSKTVEEERYKLLQENRDLRAKLASGWGAKMFLKADRLTCSMKATRRRLAGSCRR